MSQNVFKSYTPSFMDFDPEPSYQFDTLKELFEQPQVIRFASSNGFKEFRQSVDSREAVCLMAIYEDGKSRVVGFLEHPVEGLEDWKLIDDKGIV